MFNGLRLSKVPGVCPVIRQLKRIFGILVFFSTFSPVGLYAGGPILVDTDGSGQAILWKNGVIHYNLESGTAAKLGKLSNEEAVALVRELFDDWKNITINGVSTVSLTFVEGASLGSVDASNMNQHFTYCPPDKTCPGESAPFNSGSARTGESPILFDDDGSMTDAVQGVGASQSILGFAGPRVVESIGGTMYITEGQAILNGKFIDNVTSSSNPEVTVEQFKGAIIHELFHFMGGDHTQVNLSSAAKYLRGDKSEKDAIPTMLPLFVDGEAQLTPHFDDKVSISSLYPSAAFSSSFCRVEGTVFESDSTTQLQGVNVIASRDDDPLGEDTSSVSGVLYTGKGENCKAHAGRYILSGLTPGKTYSVKYEKISSGFTGGSSIEPCDPPQSGFEAKTLPGTFSCSAGGSVITAGTSASSEIVTTKTTTTTTGGDNQAVSSSAGGCSLLL